MAVVEPCFEDQRLAHAVNTLNKMGPEAVRQAAQEIIEHRMREPEKHPPPQRPKLYIVKHPESAP